MIVTEFCNREVLIVQNMHRKLFSVNYENHRKYCQNLIRTVLAEWF